MNADNELESAKPFLLCIELCKITSWHIVIQSQYWMINKSGLPLYIQVINLFQSATIIYTYFTRNNLILPGMLLPYN